MLVRSERFGWRRHQVGITDKWIPAIWRRDDHFSQQRRAAARHKAQRHQSQELAYPHEKTRRERFATQTRNRLSRCPSAMRTCELSNFHRCTEQITRLIGVVSTSVKTTL